MKLLDEEGRLFGTVNVIDLLVVLIAIGVVIAGVITFLPGFLAPEKQATVQVQANNVQPYIVSSVTPGVVSSDDVVRVINRSSTQANRTSRNMQLWAQIQVTTEDGDLYFGNTRLYVGNTITLDLGNTVLTVTVTRISGTT